MVDLEKNMGINFDPDSLIYDKSLRPFIAPVSSTFIDWMHTVCGSGGTAQFHINSFCLELESSLGVTKKDLDTFSCNFYDTLIRPPGQRNQCAQNCNSIQPYQVHLGQVPHPFYDSG